MNNKILFGCICGVLLLSTLFLFKSDTTSLQSAEQQQHAIEQAKIYYNHGVIFQPYGDKSKSIIDMRVFRQ